MKEVIFKKVRGKNLISLGDSPIEIEFNATGGGRINVITGENLDKKDSKNGIGKSSLVEMVFFSITGRSIRKSKLDQLINNKTKKSVETEVTFSVNGDEYVLQRRLKPTKVYLKKNGVDVTRDTVANNSSFIEELIGYDEDTFAFCVFMNMASSSSFMTSPAATKREIIEQTMDYKKFSVMLAAVTKEHTDCRREQSTLITEKTTSERFISESMNRVVEFKRKLDVQEKEFAARKQKAIDTLANLENTIPAIIDDSTLAGEKATLNAKISKLTEAKNGLLTLISGIRTENRMLNSKISDVDVSGATCSMCLRPIAEHDKDFVEKEIQTIKEKIKSNEELIKINEAKKTRIETAITATDTEMESIRNRERNIQTSIISHKQHMLSIESQKELIKNMVPEDSLSSVIKDLAKDIMAHKKGVEEIEKKISDVNIQISVLEKAKFILGDDGMKTVLIDRVIGLFNNIIQKYLNAFQSHYFVKFDKYFDDVVTSINGDEMDYTLLSGAERKYIDIAIMLAFADIKRLQSGTMTNILFFDELLDSSIDTNGLENVIKVLRERSENVYVISHRKECKMIADDTGGECIYLVKENGITTRRG